jgi:NadR type nicotinamide-nucleotide adenylyltransferase
MKKIVAIGPESTGKSTLCEELAHHYQTEWCREYAREYLSKNGKNYTYDDLLRIAKGQLEMEDKLSNSSGTANSNLLFIDTDMYVMKVWCEYVFDKCHRFILEEIVSRKYDLYLLCNTDLPWTPDELREYPDLKTREKLFSIYKDIMINQNTPWVEISGQTVQRKQLAISTINKIF